MKQYIFIIVALFFGACSLMAQEQETIIKNLDMRSITEAKTSYVILIARKDLNSGYAIIGTGREDSLKQFKSSLVMGLYQKKENDANVTKSYKFGLVPQATVNELFSKNPPVQSGFVKLTIKVDNADLELTESIIQKWLEKPNLKSTESECTAFVTEVAKALKLNSPLPEAVPAPWDVIWKIAEINSQSMILDGVWEVTDASKRFKLEISGSNCVWTERNEEGAELVEKVQVMNVQGTLKIQRPNTEKVLNFYGFKDALKKDVLAKKPLPSYMILTRNGEELTGIWHGLLAKKTPKGRLKELIQAGESTPKTYIFRKAE